MDIFNDQQNKILTFNNYLLEYANTYILSTIKIKSIINHNILMFNNKFILKKINNLVYANYYNIVINV